MDVNKYRRELRAFIRMGVKKSYKPFKKEAKNLLSLSDEELENWINANKADSFFAYAFAKVCYSMRGEQNRRFDIITN